MQRVGVVEIVEDKRPLGASSTAELSETAEIGDVWRVLWCRRRSILGLAALCALAAILYLALAPVLYTATAQLLIDPRDRQIVNKDVNPDTLPSDAGLLQVESQAHVVESDAVLLRAIRALHLDDDPDYGQAPSGLLTRIAALFQAGQADAETPEARALRELRKGLYVRRAEKVFVIDIVVTARKPDRAAKIADAVAEAYLGDQVQARAASTIRASDALASHLSDLKADVEAAAQAVERFKATHDLLGTDKQTISDQQLSDNGTLLNAARGKVAELQARVDQLDLARSTGAASGAIQEALQSSVITQLRASLADLDRRRSDLRTRYGDRYPDVIAIEAEIRQARQSIDGELDRLVRSAHIDLDRAKRNEQALLNAQGTLKRQTVSNNEAYVILDQLTRELNARRSVYESFLTRTAETREQSGIDTTNARIISRAIPPLQPSWPPKAIVLACALALGCGLGAAGAFVREYNRPTVLTEDRLAEAAGAPLLGVVPGRRSRFSIRGFGRREAAAQVEHSIATRVLWRLCGTLEALRQRSRARTILVVSAGRSGTESAKFAESLVASAADFELSVLLVDFEGARDSASATSAPGLLEVLDNTCSLRDALRPMNHPRASRIAAWRSSAREADLAGDARLRRLLKIVEPRFDVVVLRGSDPRDSAQMADLARLVDDVVMTARQGVTPVREVVATAEAVRLSAGHGVSGAVLLAAA